MFSSFFKDFVLVLYPILYHIFFLFDTEMAGHAARPFKNPDHYGRLNLLAAIHPEHVEVSTR